MDEPKEGTEPTGTATEPKPPEEPEVPPAEDDGEPGGDSPQEIRARKEYRRAKKAEERARALELETATLRGQVQALQDQTKGGDGQPGQRWTSESLQRAIEEGRVEDTGAARGKLQELKEQELEDRVTRRLETKAEQASRTAKAKDELRAYVELYPELDEEGSKTHRAVIAEMQDLVFAGADSKNPIIQVMAVKAVLGSLEKAKQRKDAERHDRMTREGSPETYTGGKGPEPKGKGGWKEGIPKAQLDYWDSQERTPEEQKKLAEHYRSTHQRPAA